MNDWLTRVGTHTEAHRERRAREYDRTAIRKRGAQRLTDQPESRVDLAGAWHERRARGQRERISRVEQCCTESLIIICQACGREHERPARCGCRLLCVRCRGARAREVRARFLAASRSVVREAGARGLLRANRRGGRWSQKLLTLTAPHLPSDTLEGRIRRVFEAWRRFLRLFNAWLRERDLRSVEWLRVFEWTPGDDALGHPHFHLWLFSPYLDHEQLREWWSCALNNDSGVTAPIIDIRQVTESDSIASELIKYLTKDIDANGEKLDPELYAKVYCALDSRRSLQSSRGLMQRANKGIRQCECGASLPKLVRRKDANAQAKELQHAQEDTVEPG